MKAKHQRLIFVTVSIVCLCIATLFVMRAFRENLVFFYSPSDWIVRPELSNKEVRIGGLVEKNSIKHSDSDHVNFVITDGKASVKITYQGLLPSLFREGQGVIAQGKASKDGDFNARTILAKHDENYMPKEVIDALKKSGQWRGEEK
jgi:cytochrome c-type biogenesis protein CcmE